MTLKIVDQGKEAFDKKLAGLAGGLDLVSAKVHLYTNNRGTPQHGDTQATYTEASFTGYAAQTVGTWTAIGLDGSFRYVVRSTAVTFTNSSVSGQTCFGYYLTDNGATKLFGVEDFPGGPLTIPAGATLTITVDFTEQTEF